MACIAAATAIWSFVAGRGEPAESAPVADAPPIWHLDGIYRIDVDFPNGVLRTKDGNLINMATLGGDAQTVYSARNTTCNEVGNCSSISIAVDAQEHLPARDESGNIIRTAYRWTGTRWVSDNEGPNGGTIHSSPCDESGTASDSSEVWAEMIPLADGTLTGTFHERVMTDGCGIFGDERSSPMTMIRVGDVPSGIFD
ncbi:hypothetical protein [Mycolicibacter algericus]|uniref:Uncharacterized protein n=1 Tax=Mycolicibacter algericus TaxID=1288388 RepID=A0A7I9Y3T7_MYCAL|nr:hypothetical protein [Mycolicibacter algericus]GFG83342.1 hypothetical protein MALGJ_00180 [Mycolicibacter algericus]